MGNRIEAKSSRNEVERRLPAPRSQQQWSVGGRSLVWNEHPAQTGSFKKLAARLWFLAKIMCRGQAQLQSLRLVIQSGRPSGRG